MSTGVITSEPPVEATGKKSKRDPPYRTSNNVNTNGQNESQSQQGGPPAGKKAVQCVFYLKGNCREGAMCAFVHGEVANGQGSTAREGSQKWTRGRAPNRGGRNYSKARNTEVNQSSATTNASGAPTANNPGPGFTPPATNSNDGHYESHGEPATPSAPAQVVKRVCFAWERKGACWRGDNCAFAHTPFPCAESTTVQVRPVQQGQQAGDGLARQQKALRLAGEARRAMESRVAAAEAQERAVEAQRVREETRRIAEERARQEAEEEARRAAEEEARRAMEEARRAREEEARRAREEARRAAEERARRVAEEKARQAEEKARREAERKARQEAEEALRAGREAAFTAQHQVLGSTLITLGSGLDIRHVVSGFESCRLTIKNLPLNTKPNEIVELFTQQGINRDSLIVDKVWTNGGHQEAVILTNKEHGAPIAVGLDGTMFRDATLRFEFGENTGADAMGQTSARDANILTISWWAPSITMIAMYDNMDIAREKARTLDKTQCGGRRVKVEMNRPPTGPAFRHYRPESIKILGLPPDIPVHQVSDFAGTAYVRALKATAYDIHDLIPLLRQRLENSGGLQNFEHNQDPDGNITAKARFESWEQAQSARDALDGVRLRHDFPLLKLFMPKPLQYISTISPQQYNAQKRSWDSLRGGSDKGSQVRIYENPHTQRVSIRVVGEEKKAVGALKVRVETLAAGEKLDTTFWHRSFASPKGREFLTKAYNDTGVFLRCDWKIQALRMYGDDDRKERVRQMIMDEVARLAQLEWTIPVKGQSIGYLVRKGLAALKERLGDDAVTLDLSSRPVRLTLRGGEEARHALNVVFEQAMNDLDLVGQTTGGGDVCPICYDDVSHPIKLGCGHVYCTPCIRHYLTSAADSKVFPLACMGDEASCKIPIAIPMIQRFLTPQQYSHLVEVAFSSYLDQHPQEFKYCTTPDCSQIYRCGLKTMLKCPSCFAEVCPSCHEEAHEGMTCGERKHRSKEEEEALNDNWATDHGVKRCPSCRVWIEKTEGCNHMKCRCGAHICWRCMGVFPEGEIYKHLGEVHGGAFDDDAGHQNNDLLYAAQVQRQFELDRERERERIQRLAREAERIRNYQRQEEIRRQEAEAARERAERQQERERAERQQERERAERQQEREHIQRLAREAERIHNYQRQEEIRRQETEAARPPTERRDREREERRRTLWQHFEQEAEWARRQAEERRARQQRGGWSCVVM